jgi:hypothetical protein
MSFDARAHLFYRVANAPVMLYPFPHFYLDSVFPDDFYRELLDRLPPLSAYTPLSETGTVPAGTYKERFSLDPLHLGETDPPSPHAPFWRDIVQWMEDGEFSRLLLGKFDSAVTERFGTGNEFRIDQDTRLIRDFTNFAIGPHTDSPRKLVSLLFYLPKDDRMSHLGTSIFEPVDPDFRCEGVRHYGFEGFRKSFTAAFRPNTLFAFFKTDRSFHGVEPIAEAQIERDLLLYNIYVNKIVHMVPPKKGFRWPWSRV